MRKAKISDIFFGTQGEGIYAGSPQVFIRFYGCNCSCRFCDTHLTAYDKYTSLELYRRVKEFKRPYHSLCITGGEPLLHRDFLKEFLRLVKYEGITTYLETNGILADTLNELIEDIDIIAMDFKLPSSTAMEQFWSEHQKFLRVALEKEVFIKMVICSTTDRHDIDEAIALILKLRAEKIPVVLQPNFFDLGKELLAKMRRLEKYCSRQLAEVKVIPQLHKITGAR